MNDFDKYLIYGGLHTLGVLTHFLNRVGFPVQQGVLELVFLLLKWLQNFLYVVMLALNRIPRTQLGD